MVWKKINSSHYSVSDCGLVRNDETEKILKPVRNRKYLYVTIRINGEYRRHAIHRLVAQAFIPNPENKETVNHINGVHDDNRVQNLEWATQRENNIHKYKVLGFRMSDSGRMSISNKRKKRIIRLEDGKKYASVSEAARDVKVGVSTMSLALHGINHTAGGYHWKFMEG